jgi:uncharacterized repeat protein (TIGR01451 family)
MKKLGLAVAVCSLVLGILVLLPLPLPAVAQGEVTGSFTVELVISNVSASDIGSYGATISWDTSDNATSQVFYDTHFHENIADYAYHSVADPTLVPDHSVPLTGLSPSTTYHYRAKSVATVNGTEFIAISDDYAFSTLPVSAPNMKFTMAAHLAKDADGNGVASPGDTIGYTAIITNVASTAATDVRFSDTPDINTNVTSTAATNVHFSDTPDINTRLVVGTVTTTQGSVLKGNLPGEDSVEVDLGDIPMGSNAVITFDVTINNPLWVSIITNQGLIEGTNILSTWSDDPTTSPSGDPTILPIRPSPSQPPSVPAVSLWGNVALATVLGIIAVWLIGRRKRRRPFPDQPPPPTAPRP